jgi:hypothetical protein
MKTTDKSPICHLSHIPALSPAPNCIAREVDSVSAMSPTIDHGDVGLWEVETDSIFPGLLNIQ